MDNERRPRGRLFVMQIDWAKVERVLVVKLRSIGDTVLSTPSLIALRRFLPNGQIDILLEEWVAPVLDGFDAVDNVLIVGKTLGERLEMARELRRSRYDVAFNLHGGSTATLLVRASGARHRVGTANYQYSFLYNHLLSSSSEFWGRGQTHSAEQQLAVLGSVGVPVADRPKSRLAVTDNGRTERITGLQKRGPYAVIHPTTAFFTKRWPVENFARTVEFLAVRGLTAVAIASKPEAETLAQLTRLTATPITTFDDLTLPEITALTSEAAIFVGNDSGMAHIAGAVNTPAVVIFGSSNRDHWRPWTGAPNEVVYEPFACQPCPGYRCEVFGDARCIRNVPAEAVMAAIDRVLS
jgi:ADP-heptose:LPS heptosyltransferase